MYTCGDYNEPLYIRVLTKQLVQRNVTRVFSAAQVEQSTLHMQTSQFDGISSASCVSLDVWTEARNVQHVNFPQLLARCQEALTPPLPHEQYITWLECNSPAQVLEGMSDVIKKKRANKYLKKCKLVTAPWTQDVLPVLKLHFLFCWDPEKIWKGYEHFMVSSHLLSGFNQLESAQEIQDPKSQVMLAGNSNVRTGIWRAHREFQTGRTCYQFTR